MEIENKMTKIEELLKVKGYRFTPSRKTLVRLFVEPKEHLKPEEIYKLTRSKKII